MKDINKVSPGYYHSKECNIADFQKIIDQNLKIDAVPNAKEIQNNIPVYDIEELQSILQSEVLKNDPGYYSWIMKSDFPKYTKNILDKIRLSELNNKIS